MATTYEVNLTLPRYQITTLWQTLRDEASSLRQQAIVAAKRGNKNEALRLTNKAQVIADLALQVKQRL